MENKRIRSFEGLRFIMIMVIVLSHFEFLFNVDGIGDFYESYLWNAGFAVDFFFMISGFGMMLGSMKKTSLQELSRPSVKDCLKYGISHIRKIYPVYAATIVFGVGAELVIALIKSNLSISWGVHEFVKIVVNLLLMQSATGMAHYTHAYNGVSWFLSCLFCIYLVAPLLLFLVRKVSKNYKIDIALIVADIVLIIILKNFLASIQVHFQNIKGLPDVNYLYYVSPVLRVFSVLIGMSLACIFNRLRENQFDLPEKKACVFEVVVSIAALMDFFFAHSLPESPDFLRDIYLFPLLSLFILVFAFDRGCVSKILHAPSMQSLGKMSMYIFMIHYPIRVYFAKTVDYLFGWTIASSFLFIAFILLSTFAISFCLYRRSQKKI